MENINQRAASRIRAALTAEGITVEEYAKAAGISHDVASKRLRGKLAFKLTDIEAGAKLTGYPVEAFIAKKPFTLKEPSSH